MCVLCASESVSLPARQLTTVKQLSQRPFVAWCSHCKIQGMPSAMTLPSLHTDTDTDTALCVAGSQSVILFSNDCTPPAVPHEPLICSKHSHRCSLHPQSAAVAHSHHDLGQGYQQHDSHEALRCLLNAVHEQLAIPVPASLEPNLASPTTNQSAVGGAGGGAGAGAGAGSADTPTVIVTRSNIQTA